MQPTKKPRVFVNSMPKSGTHLLTRAAESLGIASYMASRGLFRRLLDKTPLGSPPYFTRKSAEAKAGHEALTSSNQSQKTPIGVHSPLHVRVDLVRRWLSAVRPGQYIIGHVPYSSTLEDILRENDWKMIYIVRDPRAVMSSFLYYVIHKKAGEHFLEHDSSRLDREQQIEFALKGGLARIANVEIVGMTRAYETVLGWGGFDGAFRVRFEDLVGERGGGSATAQEATVRALAGHLGVDIEDLACIDMKNIFRPSSPTFHLGQIDSWQTEFEEEQIERLDREFAPLLGTLGYPRVGSRSTSIERVDCRERRP